MRSEQEPKYRAVVIPDPDVAGAEPDLAEDLVARIQNRASGEIIPDDEPIFIFRARDRYAASVLRYYASLVEDQEHEAVVLERLQDFKQFADKHPERMHEPTTSRADLDA